MCDEEDEMKCTNCNQPWIEPTEERACCPNPTKPRADPHVKSPLRAQAGGAPVTPSALESALAKLRVCAMFSESDTNVNVRVYSDQAAALLAKIETADKLAEFLVNLRADSTGVAGYHLNGDIAEWDEFEEMNLLAAYRNPAPAP